MNNPTATRARSPFNVLRAGPLILFLLLSQGPEAAAIEVPAQAKGTVAFIYAPLAGTNNADAPDGTGFFVSVNHGVKTNGFFVYLVTAKHVLQPSDNSWLSEVRVRLNRRTGGAEKIVAPLIPMGTNKNVFTHSDPTVDIAVLVWGIPPDEFDYTLMDASVLALHNDLPSLKIQEGSEVFFTGMFVYHLGSKRNLPILRFGKVALLSDEKIYFDGEERDLYLIEASAFGGNSGSPVFFLTGYENPPNVNWGVPRSVKLAGVLSGRFNDAVLVKTISTGTTNATFPSLGISAVVPAQKLHDILFSEELKKSRALEQ